jgi:hypothetical protein
LYYGTSTFVDVLKIVRFSKEQVDNAVAGEPIEFSQGQEIISGIESNFDMVWVDGALFYTDLGFASGEGQIWRLLDAEDFSQSVFASFPSPVDSLVSPTYLAVNPGRDGFGCGLGREKGGSMAVVTSDFSTLVGVSELFPELHFRRGRVNSDDLADGSDAIALLGFLFLGNPGPDPLVAGDINDDNHIDVSDSVFLLRFLFLGGSEPPPPFREPGPDPTPDPAVI